MEQNAISKDESVRPGPEQARVLRKLMWAYMFFFPIVNTYCDGIGWLILLLVRRVPNQPEAGRLKPRTIAIAGLFVSVVRLVLFAGRGGMTGFSDAVLRSFSLLLAAAFLWEVCRPVIETARQVGNRYLPRQARLRGIAYAVYAVLPAAFSAVHWTMTPTEGLAVQAAYVLLGTVVTMAVVGLMISAGSLCRAASIVPEEPEPAG